MSRIMIVLIAIAAMSATTANAQHRPVHNKTHSLMEGSDGNAVLRIFRPGTEVQLVSKRQFKCGDMPAHTIEGPYYCSLNDTEIFSDRPFRCGERKAKRTVKYACHVSDKIRDNEADATIEETLSQEPKFPYWELDVIRSMPDQIILMTTVRPSHKQLAKHPARRTPRG